MVTLLLKKSYQIKSLQEVPFNDLWGKHGVFTTIRLLGKPLKLIFFKEHIKNLLNSCKNYKIYNKDLNIKLKKIIKINLYKNKNYNHLLRLAVTKNLISISVRNRLTPSKNFKLKFLNYKRKNPLHKNLKYEFILSNMKNINVKSTDLSLIYNNRIFETGTANLIFVKKGKLYSPKENYYKGITLKFVNKAFSIKFLNIQIKNLNDYEEIILVGSGKGIVSVNSIESVNWRRKSLKYFKILNNYYQKAVTKCPRYYS